MKGNESSRARALQGLLELRTPVAEAVAALHEFPWDSDQDLLSLTNEHVLGALDRYLSGMLAAGQLEAWAGAVDGRDDVDFGGPGSAIRQIVFELSSPELFGPMPDLARSLRERLGKSAR